MKNWLIIIASVSILAACSENTSDKQAQDSGIVDNKNTIGSYHRYEGTIAGQPVVLQLLKNENGNVSSAAYYYVAHGKSIDLYWQTDTVSDESYLVDEMPEVAGDGANAYWHVVATGNTIKGQWLSGNGANKYDIDLKENYPDGTYRFSRYAYEDTIPYKVGRAEPAASMSWSLLLPAGDVETVVSDLMNDVIRKNLGCDTLQATTIDDCLQKQKNVYTKFYRESLEGLDDTMLSEAMNNYYTGVSMFVTYNADNWVSFEFNGDEYMGGAHGMYYSRYVNLDVRSKKIWQLADVMQVDSSKMTALLEKEAARYFDVDDLKDMLLVDHIPPTGNFFATNKGLTFHYDPYEIMPYAAGSVNLFIPYTGIKDLLTPAFKKRMNLN